MKRLLWLPLLVLLILAGCLTRKPLQEGSSSAEASAVADQEAAGAGKIPEPVKEPEKKLVEKRIVETLALVAKESSFYAPEILDNYIVYTYRPAPETGLVKKQVYDMDNRVTEYVEYQYRDGLPEKAVTYTAEGAVKFYHQYAHDGRGSLAEDGMYDAKNSLQTSSGYEYGEDNRKIRWNVYSGDNVLQAYTLYSYGDQGLARVDFFSAAGENENYIIYDYTENGEVGRESYYTAEGVPDRYTEFSYKDGHAVQEIHYLGSKSVQRKVTYKLDDKGTRLEAVYLNASDIIQEIKRYEYIYRDVERTIQVYE
ncbi:MAG: hypothetical protein E4H36_05175 [Spirochaetales bacterium]|nr:MAG: hypothetical protein E4H36_05175 [Spirochaetales bacterium]